jgi:eukaryotic-like serine/threonine-protein kinase
MTPGTKLGRYEVRSKLGAGGMGEVYLAHDSQLDRAVALKILPTELAADKQRMQRFIQEARTSSSLNQANILTVFEIGESDNTHFIATEFIDGETLRHLMARESLGLREALDIAMQVASALTSAHKAGVVHRDIKPENIMVRRDDRVVKVLDFGLAKLTESQPAPPFETSAPTKGLIHTEPGVVIGTAQYMSPEQARTPGVDARTDIWSLGVVLYEMVAGRRPFEGPTTTDVIANILHKEPPALTLLCNDADTRLDEIVTKALTKDKEERYQSAKDLFIDLKRLKQHLDIEAEIDRTTPPELTSANASGDWSRARQRATAAARQSAARTVTTEARPTSSAEYIVSEIKRHKKGTIVIAGLIAILTVGSIVFFRFRGAHALTEKDSVLLADFVNTTGDAVFDGTLKQALAAQLSQSPFLNILSEDRVREALRFMGRSPDDRLTRDVAREICQRQALKAMLAGSIANLGNHYVITLEAINAQTGDGIAREQTEAENKEQVLRALGEAATKLREKLGESLQSIEKFDAPIEQATTSSLEAFKAYSLGLEQHLKGRYLEAVPLYKRAIEIDPNFASAHLRLSTVYHNSRQYDPAAEASQRAYDLRERVSERERLYIVTNYYDRVTGELDKYIETMELWKRTYPRDYVPHNNLSLQYIYLGQFEKGVTEAREAIALNPNAGPAHSNLAIAFVALNRFDEAQQVIEQALSQKIDTGWMHRNLYMIAFIRGDTAAMNQQLEWAHGKPDEYAALDWQAQTAAFSGQLQKATEFSKRAAELALSRNLKEVMAQYVAEQAGRDAVFGNCKQVREQTAKALEITQGSWPTFIAANALAGCGEVKRAQALTDQMLTRYPKGTLVNKVFVPLIQARSEMYRGNAGRTIELLETARPFEKALNWIFPIDYLRGQAYLSEQKGMEAAAAFQNVLDHRGSAPATPLYPLAHLGLARAAALQGDTAKARKAYQDFFALWKDADPDIPILIEAKQEYEKIKAV